VWEGDYGTKGIKEWEKRWRGIVLMRERGKEEVGRGMAIGMEG